MTRSVGCWYGIFDVDVLDQCYALHWAEKVVVACADAVVVLFVVFDDRDNGTTLCSTGDDGSV